MVLPKAAAIWTCESPRRGRMQGWLEAGRISPAGGRRRKSAEIRADQHQAAIETWVGAPKADNLLVSEDRSESRLVTLQGASLSSLGAAVRALEHGGFLAGHAAERQLVLRWGEMSRIGFRHGLILQDWWARWDMSRTHTSCQASSGLPSQSARNRPNRSADSATAQTDSEWLMQCAGYTGQFPPANHGRPPGSAGEAVGV
jgi:hypothetical protein